MNNKEDFGKILRNLRIEKQISQKELADKLFVSASCLCKWEKGENTPSLTQKYRIAEILGIPLEEILLPEELLLRRNHSRSSSVKCAPAKPFHTNKIVIFSALGLLLLILSSIVIIFLSRPRLFRQGYADDEMWGQIYEIAYFAPKELDSETTAQYAQKFRLQWNANTLTPSKTDIVKISFFKSITTPSQTASPYCSIFLFYEN